MKNLLRACTLITAITLITKLATAQNYRFSVDGRMGANTYGISSTFFVNKVAALDGIVTMNHDRNKFLFTGLYEEHYKFGNIEGLSWFAGAGMHIGYTRTKTTEIDKVPASRSYQALALVPMEKEVTKNKIVGGVDVIAGLDYKFANLPLHIAVDIKPYVNFMNRESDLFDGGVRIGFAF